MADLDLDKIEKKLTQLRLRDLKLLPAGRNARFMRSEQYQRLVANIRRDGCLTSVPFAALQPDGSYLVLSGNHRVQAAIDALGADYLADVMITDQPLTDQRALALQLSHNAIAGEDDPAILASLYDELDEIDWREYTGLDDKTLGLLADVAPIPISEPNLDFQTISFVFLPDEVVLIKEAFAAAKDLVGNAEAWLVAMGDYDATLDALATVGGAHAVRNQALALRLLVRLAVDNFDQLTAAWWDENAEAPRHKSWVPLHALFGVTEVPPDAARIIERAVSKMVSAGDVQSESRWRAVEYWAADALSAP